MPDEKADAIQRYLDNYARVIAQKLDADIMRAFATVDVPTHPSFSPGCASEEYMKKMNRFTAAAFHLDVDDAPPSDGIDHDEWARQYRNVYENLQREVAKSLGVPPHLLRRHSPYSPEHEPEDPFDAR